MFHKKIYIRHDHIINTKLQCYHKQRFQIQYTIGVCNQYSQNGLMLEYINIEKVQIYQVVFVI